jgi:hypothetical protein
LIDLFPKSQYNIGSRIGKNKNSSGAGREGSSTPHFLKVDFFENFKIKKYEINSGNVELHMGPNYNKKLMNCPVDEDELSPGGLTKN